jgi:hypothetical protein
MFADRLPSKAPIAGSKNAMEGCAWTVNDLPLARLCRVMAVRGRGLVHDRQILVFFGLVRQGNPRLRHVDQRKPFADVLLRLGHNQALSRVTPVASRYLGRRHPQPQRGYSQREVTRK